MAFPVDAHIGIYGLSTMGAALARNLARHGFRVAVHNRSVARIEEFKRRYGRGTDFIVAADVSDFVAALERPRKIVLCVEAGPAVDDIIEQLVSRLEPDDIIIDTGNSDFHDTERRARNIVSTGVRFLGVGMSGGEAGALAGPSLMAGGDSAAYDVVAPIFTRIAAEVSGQPCCAYLGSGGAGHYIKMIHNGIEYADMQGIAEVYGLLRTGFDLSADEIADVFETWRSTDLASYLLDRSIDVLRKKDGVGQALVDLIVDQADQTGTGHWTAREALALGVVSTSATQAVFARSMSADRQRRDRAALALNSANITRVPSSKPSLDALRDALLASRLVAFSQGFDQIAAASAKQGWHFDLAEIAALWRGGCIIRARILDRVLKARQANLEGGPLLLDPWFAETLRSNDLGWRCTVMFGSSIGYPLPVLGAALSYVDQLRLRRSPANLIQALRDAFGAHGYRRFDQSGTIRTDWPSEIIPEPPSSGSAQ